MRQRYRSVKISRSTCQVPRRMAWQPKTVGRMPEPVASPVRSTPARAPPSECESARPRPRARGPRAAVGRPGRRPPRAEARSDGRSPPRPGARSRREGEQDERDPERHHGERGEADYQPPTHGELSSARADDISMSHLTYCRQPDRPSIGSSPSGRSPVIVGSSTAIDSSRRGSLACPAP